MKKPSRDFCKKQIAKLRELPKAPHGEEMADVISGLIDALVASAESEAHAKAIVDAIREVPDRKYFVTGYEISQVAYQLRSIEMRPDPECKACGGSGFKHSEVQHGERRYEGAERCQCWAAREVVRG